MEDTWSKIDGQGLEMILNWKKTGLVMCFDVGLEVEGEFEDDSQVEEFGGWGVWTAIDIEH